MGTRLVLHQPEYTVVHMYWYEYHHNADRSWGGWHHSEIRLGLDIGGVRHFEIRHSGNVSVL